MTTDRAGGTLASEPYRWPFAGDLSGERLAVVVTGAAPWFTSRCPDWAVADAAIAAVAGAARAAGGLVVWTEHWGPSRHLPAPGERSGHLGQVVDPADLVVPCAGLDGFFGGPLDQVLRRERRDLLVLAGAAFETTVHSTLRSANDRGYECLVPVEAASPADPSLAAACASTICMSGGIFGAVCPADELLQSLATLERVPCPSPSSTPSPTVGPTTG